MRDLKSLAFVAFTAGLSASTALADPASDLSGKSARMLRPQAVLDTTLSDESAGSGLLAAKPGGKASVSGFDVLKANATLSAPTNPVIQDLSSQNAKMQRPQAVLDTTLSDGSNARMMRPQAVLDTTLSDSSANARMMRPQAVLDTTLSDESAGSGLMAAKSGGKASVSGFDVLKANATLSASTNPVIQDLSSPGAKMQRPQAVLDTALSDGSDARMMRPQAVLDTTLSDGSANARMMRPQAVLDMTLSDGSTGSADMAAKPSKQPQAPVSGFDIVKADEALQNSPQSRFNLSAVNYGSRGGLEREDLRSK